MCAVVMSIHVIEIERLLLVWWFCGVVLRMWEMIEQDQGFVMNHPESKHTPTTHMYRTFKITYHSPAAGLFRIGQGAGAGSRPHSSAERAV